MPAAAAAAPRRGNAPAPGGGLAPQPPQAESRPAAEQRRVRVSAVSGMRAQPRVRVRGEGAARLRSGRRTRGRRSRRSGFLGRGAAGDWPQRARMQMLMRVGSSCSEEGFGRGTPRAAETPPFVIDTDSCAPIARAAVKCAGCACFGSAYIHAMFGLHPFARWILRSGQTKVQALGSMRSSWVPTLQSKFR